VELQKEIRHDQETLLVVDDEKPVLEMIKLALEHEGYRVLTADTPNMAIRLAEEHAGEIQLLMTDVMMPEMNGKELAQRLRSLYPGLSCLLMSGYAATIIAHKGTLDDGMYFIQKPFSIKELADSVRKMLDRRLNRPHLQSNK